MYGISINKFKNSVKYSFGGILRVVSVVIVTIISFLLYLFLSFPGYSIQMINAGPKYWEVAIKDLIWLNIESTGEIGFLLTVMYALFVGITLVVLSGQFTVNQVRGESILGIIPGFFVAGCVGCGAGILGMIGYFGVLSTLPFKGLSIKLLSILILVLILAKTGNPKSPNT